MKARAKGVITILDAVNTNPYLSPKQKEDLVTNYDKFTKDKAKEAIGILTEQYDKELSSMTLMVLHNEFGFGEKRLKRFAGEFIGMVNKLAKRLQADASVGEACYLDLCDLYPNCDEWMGCNDEMIKDSGERTEFSTGAVRDMSEGKGSMIALPMAAILRVSKHYEAGAKKYGLYNYQKGIPVSSFIDSALRHITKYADGWDDEDHLAAAAFNILGAIQMEEKLPEMIDLECRKDKELFHYSAR